MATPPPTAPQIIIENPPTPQTTLQQETQTPPPPIPKSNPALSFSVLPQPPFPVTVVSAPQLPLQSQSLPSFSVPPVEPPSTEGLASMPFSVAVIQVYYRHFRRFISMLLFKLLIGVCFGAFMVCFF